MEGILTFGDFAVTADMAVLAAGALVLLWLATFAAWRSAAHRAGACESRAEMAERRAADLRAQAEAAERRADDTELRAREAAQASQNEMQRRMGELMNAQGQINGQMRAMSERLDGFGKRVGESMTTTAVKTQESLSKLGERLAIIDQAQKTISSLSSQVDGLQQILANKQTRGAFGQARMEAIVRDGLPSNAYRFQPTLKNKNRPDCLILFPNDTPSLVVDAKFPLEAWNLIRAATTPEETKVAESQFRRDTIKHVHDIAERYFVPGETQDTAFMFVPSESIFADIHERYEDIIQKAHRARVVIVSPSLLMLSIQVVTSLLRDSRMREQAHVIQEEVMKLLEDVGRLDDRVRRLQTHFVQANKDIENIVVSTRKVTSRGQKIQSVEIDDGEAPETPLGPPPTPAPRSAPKPRMDLPELPFTQIEEA